MAIQASKKRIWRRQPTAVKARVSQAYTHVPPPEDPLFNPTERLEQMRSQGLPTHEGMTEIVAKNRASLITDGLLTEAELQRLSQADAAELAVKRWKHQNPTWPELPAEMR